MNQTITTDTTAVAATLRAGIARQLATLYGTRAGTVGMCRDFGISWDAVDMPAETARAMMSAEIVEKTRKYVPGANVDRIEWDGTDGGMAGKVWISYGQY